MDSPRFVLAHLSDPHLAGWTIQSPLQLMNKRIFGFLSWQKNRKHIHLARILDALTADLHRQAPDHVAVTGDLTNIALPVEFERAAQWLKTLGGPRDLSVVPGNHDAYISVPWQNHLGLWSDYMTGDDGSVADTRDKFPFVRRRGPVALIGVNTALPTPPLFASGTVGPVQRARLEEMLTQLGAEGLFRIVMIHHPLRVPKKERRKRLTDGAQLIDLFARSGVELILHGHNHRSALDKVETPLGTAPVIGVPSASALAYHGKGHARYHLYRISLTNNVWHLETEIRGINTDLMTFEREGQFNIQIPASNARPIAA